MSPLRIAVFGTESTGKTTLAALLAARFGAPWSPEFVREFWDLKSGKITGADLGTIALGQMANEDRADAAAAPLVLHDTELLTNTLWADLHFPGECPDWVRNEAEKRSRRYALYLLCDTDVPYEPDPQRSFPAALDREKAGHLWRGTLEKRGLPFAEIRGGWSAREAAAIAVVEDVLRKS
jgi:NadR type nicotinamide-nucleotide adenylyltransferase